MFKFQCESFQLLSSESLQRCPYENLYPLYFYLGIFKFEPEPEQSFARKCSIMTNFSLKVSICLQKNIP